MAKGIRWQSSPDAGTRAVEAIATRDGGVQAARRAVGLVRSQATSVAAPRIDRAAEPAHPPRGVAGRRRLVAQADRTVGRVVRAIVVMARRGTAARMGLGVRTSAVTTDRTFPSTSRDVSWTAPLPPN